MNLLLRKQGKELIRHGYAFGHRFASRNLGSRRNAREGDIWAESLENVAKARRRRSWYNGRGGGRSFGHLLQAHLQGHRVQLGK